MPLGEVGVIGIAKLSETTRLNVCNEEEIVGATSSDSRETDSRQSSKITILLTGSPECGGGKGKLEFTL